MKRFRALSPTREFPEKYLITITAEKNTKTAERPLWWECASTPALGTKKVDEVESDTA